MNRQGSIAIGQAFCVFMSPEDSPRSKIKDAGERRGRPVATLDGVFFFFFKQRVALRAFLAEYFSSCDIPID